MGVSYRGLECKGRKSKNLFNLYVEYIMRLRHADDTTLMAESEEELKSLLVNV